MDHGLVKRLRGEAGDRLAEQRRLDAASGMPPMSGEDERQFARAVIAQVLEDHARSEIIVGRTPIPWLNNRHVTCELEPIPACAMFTFAALSCK